MRLVAIALLSCGLVARADSTSDGKLAIHYINVEQGGATLIIGPNGTRIMYDFGNLPGGRRIGAYLRNKLHMVAGDGVEYAMVSHGDKDHYMGYKDFVQTEGFDVLIANYEPGTDKKVSPTMQSHWLAPAEGTRAKAFQPITVGLRISLGDGAEAHVVAANGVVAGDRHPMKIKNENDRSIALFIRYGKFSYILDGDLGGGPEPCTLHDTNQVNVQQRVADALFKNDLLPKDSGVTVMHVAHHGSESSTPSGYYNALKPQIAVISVGSHQGTFLHPRVDVIDKVLLQTDHVACVTAPPVKEVFQTSEGPERPCSATGCMSFSGLVGGDIVVTTDGRTGYDVKTTQARRRGKDVAAESPADLLWHFDFDSSAGPVPAATREQPAPPPRARAR